LNSAKITLNSFETWLAWSFAITFVSLAFVPGIPFSSYAIILLTFLIGILVITKGISFFYTKAKALFFLPVLYLVISIGRFYIDITTFLSLSFMPFMYVFFYSILSSKLSKSINIFISIYCSFVIGLLIYEVLQQPSALLEGVVYNTYIEKINRVFNIIDPSLEIRSTDLIGAFFLVAIFLSKEDQNSFLRFFLLSFLLFLSLFLDKYVLIISFATYILVFYVSKVRLLSILGSLIAFIFIITLPIIFMSDYVQSFLQNDLVNIALNGRGEIWHAASQLIINTESFLFGAKTQVLIMPVSGNSVEISFHSAWIRLFITEGYIFYVLSISLFAMFLVGVFKQADNNNQRILLSLIMAQAVLYVSDGSIFNGFNSIPFLYLIALAVIPKLDRISK
jgi:hypothetical protein